jgi:hypothetical protein
MLDRYLAISSGACQELRVTLLFLMYPLTALASLVLSAAIESDNQSQQMLHLFSLTTVCDTDEPKVCDCTYLYACSCVDDDSTIGIARPDISSTSGQFYSRNTWLSTLSRGSAITSPAYPTDMTSACAPN